MPSLIEKKIKHLHIIINPAAGKREPVLPIINEAMKEAGIAWDISITKQAGDGLRLAKAAVKQGVDAVAVYGGDGTLMEVASGLMGSEVPLVILPGGSANVMANELNIPKDLKEACTLMSQSSREIRTVDMGQFQKHYFLVGVSIGFSADLVKGADRATKNRFGILAYVVSTAAALQKLKLAHYHLKIDDKAYEVQGLTCIVANAGNLGFTKISMDRHIDVSDGLLDVVVVRKANLSLLKLLMTTLLTRERPDNFELVAHWQGKDISIASSRKQVVQCDGEMLEDIPPHIKIVQGAINILVPKHEDKVSA